MTETQKDRPWLFRTYAGHSTAKASNELYRGNLAKGQTGLSVAFDLPTQTGYDSDHRLARGEVVARVLEWRRAARTRACSRHRTSFGFPRERGTTCVSFGRSFSESGGPHRSRRKTFRAREKRPLGWWLYC